MAQVDYIFAETELDLRQELNRLLKSNRHLEVVTIHPVGIGYVAWVTDKLK